jgi:hypothetical protein
MFLKLIFSMPGIHDNSRLHLNWSSFYTFYVFVTYKYVASSVLCNITSIRILDDPMRDRNMLDWAVRYSIECLKHSTVHFVGLSVGLSYKIQYRRSKHNKCILLDWVLCELSATVHGKNDTKKLQLEGVRVANRGILFSSPAQQQDFLFSPKASNQLWCPSSVLRDGCHGIVPQW